MNRRATAALAALATVWAAPTMTSFGTPSAVAASNTGVSSINVDPATQIQMRITANCVAAEAKCYFNTAANLMTPNGPTGFPGDAWSRQTVTLRSSDRNVYQDAWYSAPAGVPRELKGANHNNVLSKLYKGLRDVEISVTAFGGGDAGRYTTDGDSRPLEWSSGQPAMDADFIACTQIQVVYSGVNLTTPSACAQTTFS